MDTPGPVGTVSAFCRSFLVRIVQAGSVPEHVAFIMDGNRRYAKKRLYGSTSDGHAAGFNTLSTILDFGYRTGVKEFSVFAFSIENFKRPQNEVDSLMDIANTRLQQIVERGDLVDRYGVRVNVVGNTALLPPQLLATIQTVSELTKNNDKVILNICMPYTARDDMAHAIQEIAGQVAAGELNSEDIKSSTITSSLYRGPFQRPLDLLVRTSSLARLSDFLLWEIDEHVQSNTHRRTYLDFTNVLWPEYTVFQFFKSLIRYGYSRS